MPDISNHNEKNRVVDKLSYKYGDFYQKENRFYASSNSFS